MSFRYPRTLGNYFEFFSCFTVIGLFLFFFTLDATHLLSVWLFKMFFILRSGVKSQCKPYRESKNKKKSTWFWFVCVLPPTPRDVSPLFVFWLLIKHKRTKVFPGVSQHATAAREWPCKPKLILSCTFFFQIHILRQ